MVPICAVVAACKASRGIGKNGDLPWGRKLPNEMKHFERITSRTRDPSKRNAVVMGRKTWESIPKKFKPLPKRLNIVLSSRYLDLADAELYPDVKFVASFEIALAYVKETDIETVMVIGGSSLYEEAFNHPKFDTLYLTEIMEEFESDTFLKFDENMFKESNDLGDIPAEIQEENGIKYKFLVLKKMTKV